MESNDDLDVGSGWANAPRMDSEYNRAEYDELGARYESIVADWNYVAPSGVADMILNHSGGASGRVLDCACGTGLTGAALHNVGFREIVGADISTVSLAVAREKNVYADLHEVDLQSLPLEQFAEKSFDAVQCVAAMAFIEAEPMFREMCRLARPGGVALYTQRVDLYEARGYEWIEQRLASEGAMEPTRMQRTAAVSTGAPGIPREYSGAVPRLPDQRGLTSGPTLWTGSSQAMDDGGDHEE